MGKLVKFSVVDANGAGAGNQAIVVGDTELKTGSTGVAQALLDDGNTTITVNGVKVYEGPVDALKPMEVFTTAGARKS